MKKTMTRGVYVILSLFFICAIASCEDDAAYKALLPDIEDKEPWTFPEVVTVGINRDISRIGYIDNGTSGVKQT